jgi:nucleoside-diphosphate-sugar epimerase
LGSIETIRQACREVDCVVHFAGVLFAPRPETFLPRTNVQYLENMAAAARSAGVKKFILISFPHVEGESSPLRPALGLPHGNPDSVHAQTRLAAELALGRICSGSSMTPVILRAGMIYARGVLMIDVARWLAQKRLLAVWRQPTWIHLLSLPDFLSCVESAITGAHVSGIYNLGDDVELTLQEFLDQACTQWKCPPPWRLPDWCFAFAAAGCELFARIFGTPSPLTRDFIKIGRASYFGDTQRMKMDLLPTLKYPGFQSGLILLK